jgi:adenylate cyclase
MPNRLQLIAALALLFGTGIFAEAPPAAPEKVTALNSAEGHAWVAKPGFYAPAAPSALRTKKAPETFKAPPYVSVQVPANLAPQLKINGLAPAHYALQFQLAAVPTLPFAIRIGEINDRDRVYLNGQLIAATGDFSSSEPQAYDKVRLYAIPAGLLRAGTNTLIVDVQGVLEKESGIYRDRIEIGPADKLYGAYYLENLWSSLALVAYLTFGLYFLLFFIRRRNERENFYFAVFAIALVVYSGLHTQIKYEYGLQLYFWKRVQYLALFLLVPSFYYFIRNYYKPNRAPWVKVLDIATYTANAIIAGVAIAVCVSRDVKLWDHLQNNIVTYVWLIYIVGMAIVLIREVVRKNKDAIIMSVSFIILLITMFLDILSGQAKINLPPLLTYVFIFFILSMALVLANRFVRLHDETEELNENLEKFNAASRRFVPFEFLKMLDKESILDVNLGDQVQRDMAVLFSDIRSFTSLSEKMTPKENFDFINSYLDKVGPVIRDHHGFIDKYIGDAVMALFPSSAEDALEAAIAMHGRVRNWNERRARHDYASVKIGIGIHQGRVMLGTIGEHQRMDGTVIADAVNLASRIESLTKNYGAGTLISDFSWQSVTDKAKYEWRLVDRVAVKGKNEPVDLIEVFNSDNDELRKLKLRQKTAFAEALELYRKGEFANAKTAFLQLAAENSHDKTLRLYLERIERYMQFPPAEWLGFEILTEK